MFKPTRANLYADNSQRFLRRLFLETSYQENDKSNIAYTLKDEDHELHGQTFISLGRLFLEMEDTTEYEFSNQYLSGWEHWRMLTECTWFKPFVERWREELRLKLKARMIRKLELQSSSEDPDVSSRAIKTLASMFQDIANKPQAARRVGRPVKDKTPTPEQSLSDQRSVDSDYERLLGVKTDAS